MKITVAKPFTYYINGYERKDFAKGDYEVPEDCANYAKAAGFLDNSKGEDVNGNAGARNARRGKSPMPD